MNIKIKARLLHLIAIYLLLLINFTSISAQTDWFFVALTSGGNTVFIDTSFTRSLKGITQVWQKTVLPDETYTISLGEWNCAKKSFRFVQTVIYDNNGIASDRSNNPSGWRVIIPDSTAMLLYLNICEIDQNENLDKQKSENSDSSFAQIIVRKANLMSEANSNSEIIRQVLLGEKLVLCADKPVRSWYRVIDSQTNTKAWLNGNNFKIVKAKKPSKKVKSRRNR
jgi:hypothetical protein